MKTKEILEIVSIATFCACLLVIPFAVRFECWHASAFLGLLCMGSFACSLSFSD